MSTAFEEPQILAWEDDGGSTLSDEQDVTPISGDVTNVPAIYDALADHQRKEEWDSRALASWLHQWTVILISEFKLQVPTFALSVEYLRRNRLGHFRYGHNGFGLKGEIALNRLHLDREPWTLLGTLLHELLHAEQQEIGKPGKNNYHNVAFRRRAREFGLIVDERGHTQYAQESPFRTLLAARGIDVPEIPLPVLRQAGESKLRLWMCPCKIRVRVAVPYFRARCLNCGGEFVPVQRQTCTLGDWLRRSAGDQRNTGTNEGS